MVTNTKLAGIEPHGTRVVLRLRENVDLTTRSIEEILRYWIVLPECEVQYSEKGKQLTRIGFNSAADALSSFHKHEEDHEGDKPLEIITKTRTVGASRYEVAFAVRDE